MSKRYSQKQAAARVVREQLARERRRRKQVWVTSGVAAAMVIAVLAGWLVYTLQNSGDYTAPKNTYKNDVGFVVGNGPTLAEFYVDYQCPVCRSFETSAHDTIDQLLTQNKIKVVYYPVAILDRYSSNEYSTRSSATAACAADEGKINEYTQALFANQPPENTAGPSDADLIATGKTVGLGSGFEQCVKDKKYRSWTKHINKQFENRKLNGTPSVFIDGKKVEAQAALQQLQKLLTGDASNASASPSAPASAPASSSAPAK